MEPNAANTMERETESTTRTESKPESDEYTAKTKSSTSIGSGSDVKYHIIFLHELFDLSGLAVVRLFFHEALVWDNPARWTRIVSGCKEEDEMAWRAPGISRAD
jgi:hypothetical protein